jgi:hypothetical protein
MMFEDWRFIMDRVEQQQLMRESWVSHVKNYVTIEIGAGTVIQSIRRFSEFSNTGFLIRINPTDARISNAYNKQGVSLRVGALEGLRGIAAAILG